MTAEELYRKETGKEPYSGLSESIFYLEWLKEKAVDWYKLKDDLEEYIENQPPL